KRLCRPPPSCSPSPRPSLGARASSWARRRDKTAAAGPRCSRRRGAPVAARSTRRAARTRFFFSSRRRHTSFSRDWSSDVCSSDLVDRAGRGGRRRVSTFPENRRRDSVSQEEPRLTLGSAERAFLKHPLYDVFLAAWRQDRKSVV